MGEHVQERAEEMEEIAVSLPEEMMDEYFLMNKIHTPDGEGGFLVQWQEGALIKCAIVVDTTLKAIIAEGQSSDATYSVVTSRSIELEFHDVLKRKTDGAVFRVTSDGSDSVLPESSSLDIRKVTAERWALT